MMPKAFIFENVKGLLSSNGGADYKEVEKTFRELGYHMAMKVVNAKEQGTAQNRERVFVVGFLDLDEYHNFHFADNVPLTKVLRDYLEDDVDEKYYLSQKMIDGFIHKDDSFLLSPDDISKILELGVKSATKCGYEVATENDSINFTHPDSKTRRGRVGKSVAQTLDCACNQGVIESKIEIVGSLNGANESNSRIYGIDGISPTLLAGESGGGQNPVKHLTPDFRIRRLTPRECFRLMGMNDKDIVLVNSDTQSYKIAGNGIEINTMRSIIRQLYKPVKPQGSLF